MGRVRVSMVVLPLLTLFAPKRYGRPPYLFICSHKPTLFVGLQRVGTYVFGFASHLQGTELTHPTTHNPYPKIPMLTPCFRSEG
jgi:hypothetical protein